MQLSNILTLDVKPPTDVRPSSRELKKDEKELIRGIGVLVGLILLPFSFSLAQAAMLLPINDSSIGNEWKVNESLGTQMLTLKQLKSWSFTVLTPIVFQLIFSVGFSLIFGGPIGLALAPIISSAVKASVVWLVVKGGEWCLITLLTERK